MKNFLNAFLSFGLATSIEKILGFILLPIYTRYFDTAVYGVIDMMSTILAIGVVFSLLQLETSLQRYYYRYLNVKRKLMISNTFIIVLVLSLVVSLFICLFSYKLSVLLFETDKYYKLFYIISLQLPLANLSMLGLILLRFEHRNKHFLFVILVKVSLSLIFIYLFVVLSDNKLNGVFYAQVCSLIFSTSLVIYYIKDNFVFRRSSLMRRNLLRYALPQVPARIGSVLLAQANRFFMLGFLTLSSIGLYSVSLKLASAIQIINTAFIMAWNPFMHKLFENKNNKSIFLHVLPLLSGVVFLCVSLITLVSKEIVMLVTTSEYFEAYKYIGGLSLFFALYIIKEVVDIGPKITEKTIYVSYVFFVSVIVNLLALYFLTKHYQLNGVVISMILTNIVLFFGAWFVSNLLYPIKFDLVKFLGLLFPCLVIVLLILFVDVKLIYRAVLSLIVIVFYVICIKKDFYKFKSVLK